MEFDIIKIRSLCDKFFDGETSAEEEMMLRDYFAQADDIPTDLKAVKVMICGLSDASSMTYAPKAPKRKTLVRKFVWGTVAVAASVAMILALNNRGVSDEASGGEMVSCQTESLEGMKYLTYLGKFETAIEMAEMITLGIENND